MARRSSNPWHVWPIGFIAVLVYGAAAIDYTLVRLSITAYTGRLPGMWNLWVDDLPTWVSAFWAVGVWGGVLGAILLMLRDPRAVLVFAGAFVAFCVAAVGMVAVVSPSLQDTIGNDALFVLIVGGLFLMLLWLYARRLKIAGQLE